MNDADAALLRLLETLRTRGYHFVTPTPATHARVVARPGRDRARDLADIFGWSLPFERGLLDGDLLALLEAAGAMEDAGQGLVRSAVRVSWLKGELFLHSAYPTEEEDAVFFGPDSYRFGDLIEAELARHCPPGARIVDIGTGSGVGGIVAARLCPGASVVLTDINPKALRLARINAAAAGVAVQCVEGDDLSGVEGSIDVALANPPYIMDAGSRAYRDGGEMRGGKVSFEMTRMAVEKLAPGGRVVLYTGSAIAAGEDVLRDALAGLAAAHGLDFSYRELDPDVFGEELDQPPYAEIERIAVVGAILTRR
ncbi:methyltransferase [Sphingomonas xinjiangensis]|uniref:Methylase of polypeptide subunit release factors n=1 Tax=Sphingomonas xinjiangensis TaxID=643568 RepID=A0A840YCH1_9SPHN|nr:class I SAM-dependent methyltransferase [Sphingomonas xinjiangensis]MBB5709709.1 methylase of polypeptide subunit release factors [Sphingomonas xinjiangensis]